MISGSAGSGGSGGHHRADRGHRGRDNRDRSHRHGTAHHRVTPGVANHRLAEAPAGSPVGASCFRVYVALCHSVSCWQPGVAFSSQSQWSSPSLTLTLLIPALVRIILLRKRVYSGELDAGRIAGFVGRI